MENIVAYTRGPGKPAWSEWFCGAGVNAREVRSGVHGSGMLVVTVNSGNADVPIIDIKPREQDYQQHKARRPLLRHPPSSHTDRLIRQAAAFNPSSTCSRVRPVQKTVVTGSPAGILHPICGISRIGSLASRSETASSMTRSRSANTIAFPANPVPLSLSGPISGNSPENAFTCASNTLIPETCSTVSSVP